MSVETDTRDKVIRMGAELEALTRRFDAFDEKMDTVHMMVVQARGIGWFGLTMIPVAGAIGSFITWLAQRMGLHI